MHPKQAIFKAIEDVFGIDKKQLCSNSRVEDIMEAKKVFCYVLYNNGLVKISHSNVGKLINIDRTTALHHIVTCKGLIQVDSRYNEIVQQTLNLFIKYSGDYKIERIESKIQTIIQTSQSLTDAVNDLIQTYTDLKLEIVKNFEDELR
jgi:hypothetical protein